MGAASVVAGDAIVRARFDNTEVSALVTALDSKISRHTGKELRRFRLVFRSFQDDEKKAIEAAAHAGTRVHLGPQERDEATWILGDYSFQYRDGEPLVTYSWTLEQEEHFHIDCLQIGEVSFRPHRYEEKFEGSDVLTIYAYLRVSAGELETLRKMPQYFLVVRGGINDAPRTMRFGQVLWSSTDEAGSYKLRAVLVDQHSDELNPRSHGFLEPFVSNTEILSAETSLLVEQLFEVLASKGVLDRADLDSMRERASQGIQRKRLDFDRVSDADEW